MSEPEFAAAIQTRWHDFAEQHLGGDGEKRVSNDCCHPHLDAPQGGDGRSVTLLP